MLNFDQFKSKNIGIYGLGITGSSIAETLNSNGANVYVWDDNPSISCLLYTSDAADE